MRIADTLDSWLAANKNKAWLLQHGPSLLGLDPSCERLVPYQGLKRPRFSGGSYL